MSSEMFDGMRSGLAQLSTIHAVGRVSSVDGTVVWVSGLSHRTAIGDRLRLILRGGRFCEGEAIRIRDNQVALLPDDGLDGVSLNDRVALVGPASIRPGHGWIGRIIDPFGRAVDGHPLLPGPKERSLRSPAPAPAQRRGLGGRLQTKLNIFDTMLPIAHGQRIGLFAGSGVGKSRLLGQLARNMQADVVVLALVGERGRELREFVTKSLGAEGMARSVVVTATSDKSPLERRRCLYSAMSVAEYFRDSGKHVLLLADSVTRFAEAHREVAVAAGEIPALRGFPASVSHEIMALCERAGPGIDGHGDITAVFSVLVAGSDMEEPIADILRGVLDGHVVLDRKIAERGRFPAIDLLRSVSRSLPDAANESENRAISQARALLTLYESSENLVRAGLYRKGSDPQLDHAVAIWPEFDAFLAGENATTPEIAFDKLRLLLRSGAPQGGSFSTKEVKAAV